MRTTYKTALLIALLLAPARPGYAQDTGTSTAQVTRLMHFAANNREFDAIVENRALDLFKKQITACPTAEQAVRQLPTPYGKILFPPDANYSFPEPTQGIWAEHVKIKGCNKIWTINMLAVARPSQKPLLLALLPGETLSDPAIQRNAERIGATAIKKADADSCAADAAVTYTTMLGYRENDGSIGKTDTRNGWFEEWAYSFCQRQVPVQIAYLPNNTGRFDIKARVVPAAMPKVPESKPAPADTPKTPPPAGPDMILPVQ